MAHPMRPVRLFLDTGVIISGCKNPMSAARGVLILPAQTPSYSVVLAEAVDNEVRRIINRTVGQLDESTAQEVKQTLTTLRKLPYTEWYGSPSEADINLLLPTVLPALRHKNDLAIVVTAIQARPDWVIASNVEHFTPTVGQVTGLRIISPWAFLTQLQSP
jgi:hypothetical protein